MSDIKILEDVVLFDVIIGGSTGEKTVSGDDFIREVGKMLPTGTYSWVQKHRAAVKREILKHGTARLVDGRLRGYFVPLAQADAVVEAIKNIKIEFAKDKADFLAKLPGIINDWANAPENDVMVPGKGVKRSELIRASAPSVSVVDRTLTFAHSAISIKASSFFGDDDSLHTEVKGMAGNAAQEIAADVKLSWRPSQTGKATTRVLGVVARVRNKANAMSLINDKFARLRDLCDNVLQRVPAGGSIEGADLLMVEALLHRCTSAERILADAPEVTVENDLLINAAEQSEEIGEAPVEIILDPKPTINDQISIIF